MEFGVFYEHQNPRPWAESDELRIYQEALDQVELADSLGYDYAWEVEHHFLEEYSHSPAPEVFLAAAARNTDQIRLGHGIKLMPPAYNPPFRVAEQVAALDLVSEGRVEWGTGESGSKVEIGGAGVPREEKFPMWQETTEQVANMMAMEPYPGFAGEYFELPTRNVIPKPVQKPHPPLWVACSSPNMIKVAAQAGVGALCFSFADPDTAEEWVDTYYETFKEQCVPIGRAVNPNIAMVSGFSMHEDHQVAEERGKEGIAFFQYGLAHYYAIGGHKPGYTNLWEQFQAGGGVDMPMFEDAGHCIGDPSHVRERIREFEEAGVDQVILLQQGGENEHEHICESLELFAERLMPEFTADEESRQREKAVELEPYIEEALERKEQMADVSEDDVPTIYPYERELTEEEYTV